MQQLLYIKNNSIVHNVCGDCGLSYTYNSSDINASPNYCSKCNTLDFEPRDTVLDFSQQEKEFFNKQL